MRRGVIVRILVGVLAAVVVLPTVALAGKKVVSGEQSLQITVKLRPAKAGARGASLTFTSVYLDTKPGGQQPPYDTKSITFAEPAGLTLNTSAVPSCAESAVVKANGDASVCPAASQVGSGTVIANGRPFIKTLIHGTITIYNGVDDAGAAGFLKRSPELILGVSVKLGTTPVKLADIFHIIKSGGREKLLSVAPNKPAKPGIAPGDFSLQKLKLTIFGSKKKPFFVLNPKACHGSWPFSLTIKNFFGAPSVTARDTVSCHPY